MKVVSLNLWGGKAFGPLMNYLRSASSDTDVFCFQEVFSSPEARVVESGQHMNLLEELTVALPGFRFFFVPVQDRWAFGAVDFNVSFGQCIAVAPGAGTVAYRDRFIFGGRNTARLDDMNGTMGRVVQSVTVGERPLRYAVFNFHGIATWPKVDTPARLEQSRLVRECVDGIGDRSVLCGDFNLRSDTESVRILARGMQNLTETYGIATTRSRLCMYENALRDVSDYCFVSANTAVESFTVPDVAVSDHLPLVLEFS